MFIASLMTLIAGVPMDQPGLFPFPCMCDLDQSGLVDLRDFDALATGIENGHFAGDVNADGRIDFADFGYFQRHVGTSCFTDMEVELLASEVIETCSPFAYTLQVTNTGTNELADYPLVDVYLSQDQQLDEEADLRLHSFTSTLPSVGPTGIEVTESINSDVISGETPTGDAFLILSFLYRPTNTTYFDVVPVTVEAGACDERLAK